MKKVILTRTGILKIREFVKECADFQRALLTAHLDTANDAILPTMKEIEEDLERLQNESADTICGYCNAWNIADNHISETLVLKLGEDFVWDKDELLLPEEKKDWDIAKKLAVSYLLRNGNPSNFITVKRNEKVWKQPLENRQVGFVTVKQFSFYYKDHMKDIYVVYYDKNIFRGFVTDGDNEKFVEDLFNCQRLLLPYYEALKRY